jgi:hypothetical protein
VAFEKRLKKAGLKTSQEATLAEQVSPVEPPLFQIRFSNVRAEWQPIYLRQSPTATSDAASERTIPIRVIAELIVDEKSWYGASPGMISAVFSSAPIGGRLYN